MKNTIPWIAAVLTFAIGVFMPLGLRTMFQWSDDAVVIIGLCSGGLFGNLSIIVWCIVRDRLFPIA